MKPNTETTPTNGNHEVPQARCDELVKMQNELNQIRLRIADHFTEEQKHKSIALQLVQERVNLEARIESSLALASEIAGIDMNASWSLNVEKKAFERRS